MVIDSNTYIFGLPSPFLAQSSWNSCKFLSMKGIFCSMEATLGGLLDGSRMEAGHQQDQAMETWDFSN